jgi:hypothetical protein
MRLVAPIHRWPDEEKSHDDKVYETAACPACTSLGRVFLHGQDSKLDVDLCPDGLICLKTVVSATVLGFLNQSRRITT